MSLSPPRRPSPTRATARAATAAVAAAAFALAVALAISGAARAQGPGTAYRPGGPLRSSPNHVQVEPAGDSIWVLSAGTANAVACLTGAGWVLVDTGTRAEALALRNELSRLAVRPFALVINTHFHDDHAGGNGLYRAMGVPVLAGRRTQALERTRRERLERGAPREIQELASFEQSLPGRLPPGERERLVAFTQFLQQWWSEGLEDARQDSLAVVPATQTFSGTARRTVGGTRLVLRELGSPAHTGGDAWVLFPDRRVAAVGDVFARGSAPWADRFMGDGSLEGILAAQDSLLAALARLGAGPTDTTWRLVPGHGPPGRIPDLVANRRALAELRTCARLAFNAGRSREASAEDCAGVGFPGFGGGYAVWQFDSEWRAKSAPKRTSPADPAPGRPPD